MVSPVGSGNGDCRLDDWLIRGWTLLATATRAAARGRKQSSTRGAGGGRRSSRAFADAAGRDHECRRWDGNNVLPGAEAGARTPGRKPSLPGKRAKDRRSGGRTDAGFAGAGAGGSGEQSLRHGVTRPSGSSAADSVTRSAVQNSRARHEGSPGRKTRGP